MSQDEYRPVLPIERISIPERSLSYLPIPRLPRCRPSVWDRVPNGRNQRPKFKNSNLSYSNLYAATIKGTDLSEADLSYANLSEIDLIEANIIAAILLLITIPDY